jgi:hypothetical protein
MAYVNKHDKGGKCSREGHAAEKSFVQLAEDKSFEVTAATRKANMFSHIDFILTKAIEGATDHVVLKVDVKSRKRTSRKDKRFNDDWIWLEFRNVQGKNGWLKGESTHIAFEREREFVLVPRENLFNWSKKAIANHNGGEMTIKCKAKSARDARYKYYTRWERDDLLTQVSYEDMVKQVNGVEIWEK